MAGSGHHNARQQWSARRLRGCLAAFGAEDTVIVLANRQPFRHDLADDGAVVVTRSAGGLVTALEPVVEAAGGVWVAHGAGAADRRVVDERDGLEVPRSDRRYRLRRIWLEADEEQHYYYGFSNEGLWPLCHRTHVSPVFRADDFERYWTVNDRFANAAVQEAATARPVVFVQDYHLALAPQMIRRHLPLSTIISFWHIPWPTPDDFSTCPWGTQLLQGLLGSTIMGFQTRDDCRAFMDTVECLLDADVDRHRGVIAYMGNRTAVRTYPVSVEWPNRWVAAAPPIEACRAAIRRELHLPQEICLGVGVDRLDYTKGIAEKFLVVERLLELHPEFRGRFTFVQIAEPSRDCLPAYRATRSRIVETAGRVNGRFASDHYRPIILLEARHEPADVYRFLRAADVCYVGSLHDGMNLVAKEFVCARTDNRGVLVLSASAGAARELTTALMVNPYETDRCAQALAHALEMPEKEQSTRMRVMRSTVAHHNAYWWAGQMLMDGRRFREVDDVAHPRGEGTWPRNRRQWRPAAIAAGLTALAPPDETQENAASAGNRAAHPAGNRPASSPL